MLIKFIMGQPNSMYKCTSNGCWLPCGGPYPNLSAFSPSCMTLQFPSHFISKMRNMVGLL